MLGTHIPEAVVMDARFRGHERIVMSIRHDRAVHGFRPARPLHGSDEGGAAPDGAGHTDDRSLRGCAGRQSQGIGLSARGLRPMVCGGGGGFLPSRPPPRAGGPAPSGSRRTRPPVMLEADGRWYVGPGNGLFELIRRRAAKTRSFDIDFKPKRLSASFHGRDLFAPVAAKLARGEPPPGRPRKDDADRRRDWPDALA